MSGISGYASPVKKRLEAQNPQANDTSQPTRPANTDIAENSNKSNPEIDTEVNPPIVIESIYDQCKTSDVKSNTYKVIENTSETSYISALSGTLSHSYERLYSSEDSLPKVIDEHDEKRKSCIVIRDSTADIQTEDSNADDTRESKLKSKKLLDKTDNEMKDDGPDLTAQKQTNPLLKVNASKEDYTKKNKDTKLEEALQTTVNESKEDKKNQDAKLKEALQSIVNESKKDDFKKNEDEKLKEAPQSTSAKLIVDETPQFSQVRNNVKKGNPATASATEQNETKKTESFTTQYLLSADKLDESKLKKLAHTPKTDNLDQRSKNANEIINNFKTNIDVNDASITLTLRNSTTNTEDLQRGENCLNTLPTESNENKPIGISPGKLDILNDLHNTGEGTTHYDVGDNLLEKPNAPIHKATTRKLISTESQIENLQKIRHMLEDNLKRTRNPEEDEEYYQDAVSDPQSDKVRSEKAGKSASDESEHTKLLDMLTEKTSKIDKLKSVKSSVTVVEVVKFIPEALVQGMPSTAFKLPETPADDTQCLKSPISKEAPITVHSEDASEIIQVILPDENLKAALIGELVKVEPKDSCKPCPGIKPSRTSCLDPPEEPVPEAEEYPPPPPHEKKPPPFECFEPEDTPEYEGSDTDSSGSPPSGLRMWWWKFKQRVLTVVLGMYNCFHCDRICPIFSPARLQSPNTSAAYEVTQPVKIPNSQIKINSNSALIHSKDSVHIHSKYRRVTAKEVEQRMIKSEGVNPEKSRSAVMPERIKSTRFDLDNIKAVDSEEVRQMPVKSTVPRKF